MVRPFDCALHNRRNVCNIGKIPQRTPSPMEAWSPERGQAKPNMRHNLSTLCLLQHTYRHTCNMCTKCHGRIMARYSLP